MDPSLYKAARSGDLGFLRRARDSKVSNSFLDQKTPKDNNILHVAAEFKQIDFFINAPLDDQSPLFWATNKKGNTPLHVAARVGCHEVVKFLIEHAQRTLIDPADQESGPADANAHKELLRKTNSQKDTALHVAVRNEHAGVVTLLVEADPHLCSFTNSANESPLFLAVRNGYANIVLYILNESPIFPSFHGTNGVTALHMAVTRKHLTGRGKHQLIPLSYLKYTKKYSSARFCKANTFCKYERGVQIGFTSAYIYLGLLHVVSKSSLKKFSAPCP